MITKHISRINDICKCPCIILASCEGLDAIRYDFCGKTKETAMSLVYWCLERCFKLTPITNECIITRKKKI